MVKKFGPEYTPLASLTNRPSATLSPNKTFNAIAMELMIVALTMHIHKAPCTFLADSRTLPSIRKRMHIFSQSFQNAVKLPDIQNENGIVSIAQTVIRASILEIGVKGKTGRPLEYRDHM